ncbi:MAG: hypothetical protein Phyf2KO_26110 [Phycisphaerales bacterium]
MKHALTAFALALLAGACSAQNTITVPDDVPNLELALNPGVSGLAAGDTIVLRDIVSHAGAFTITTPDITIREAAGDNVVVDAFATGSVFTVDIPSGSVTFENLTIQNGLNLGAGNNGGAINLIDGDALNVIGCELIDNRAHVGGAIFAVDCNLTIENSSFTGNISDNFGGAVRSSGSPGQLVSITGSTFIDNDALNGNGGALDHAGDGASVVLADCTFSENTCTITGAAAFITAANQVTVTNTDFLDNISIGTASQDTGGLYVNAVDYAYVDDCDFERNLCAGSGGGIRFNNSAGDIVNCRFIGNEASNGGAIQIVGAAARGNVYNCVFDGNSARRQGNDSVSGAGAVMVNVSGILNIYNSLFINNTAITGGAISSATDGEARVYNSTFYNNDADAIGGALRRLNPDAIVFANSCVFFGNLPTGSQIAINGTGDNDEVNFSLVEGGFTGPGTGNIDGNPMFVDAANGDYSLMPTSPCIDAGSSDRYIGGPLSDLGGNDRGQDDPDTTDTGEAIIGAVIDMGAFEFNSDSGIPDCPADQNFDGMLSPTDFTAWINNYNQGCN